MKLAQKNKHKIVFLEGVLLFALLVIIFTYPLILHITDSIPEKNDYTDGPMFLWNLWWVKESLLHFNSPFYTTMIFAPQSANLSLHTLTLSLGFICLPLTLILKNFLLVGNLIIFASFGLTGFFTYKLLKLLFKSTIAAYFSACYLALHPFIISHLYAGHYNLIQIWTIPAFYWIWFTKFNNWQIKSLWLMLVAGLSFGLALFTHTQTGLWLVFFVALFIYWIIENKANISLVVKTAFKGLIFLLGPLVATMGYIYLMIYASPIRPDLEWGALTKKTAFQHLLLDNIGDKATFNGGNFTQIVFPSFITQISWIGLIALIGTFIILDKITKDIEFRTYFIDNTTLKLKKIKLIKSE